MFVVFIEMFSNMEKKNRRNVHALLALMWVGVLAVWSSCDEKDSIASVEGEPLLISANIRNLDSDEYYKLNGGESVGLWVSSTDNSLQQADIAKNVKFYQSAAGLVSEPRTYSGNHQDLYINGYYPFDSAAVVSPQAYKFFVESDQRIEENVVASDLLWTKKVVSMAGGSEKILLEFSHLMSRLVINVRGSYPEAGSLRECGAQIINAISDASVDLKEGLVVTGMERTTIEAMPLMEIADKYESSLQAIVVPQTFSAGEPLLKIITKGNVENEWAPQQDIVVGSGMQLVLDVLIEETECIVTIKDIAPWEVDDDILYAEAVEKVPSYELFDFYSRFGVQGIVIALDEGTDGKHGWLISTDEAELAWSSADVTGLTGFSRTDAALNLKLALQNDATLEKFPALKWCDDKNKNRTTVEDLEQNGIERRWILLPINMLKSKFGDQFLAYDKKTNLERLNASIENSSVSSSLKVKLPTVNWNDPLVMIDYWSSSHVSNQNLARMVRCATNDHSHFGGTGVFNSTSDPSILNRVRAFYHF